jgi:AcrR family transcriptional regulator
MTTDEPGRDRPQPLQDRAQQTYERLLDITAALLAEAGVESISTNMICNRAGMTPPALYRYFRDKYAVIEALAQRQMMRQFAVVDAWLIETLPGGIEAISSEMGVLLRRLAAVTAAQEGSVWILRALRAVPRLSVVRLESHRRVSEHLLAAYAPFYPEVETKELLTRIRIGVEFTYALDELIAESAPADVEPILNQGGRMIGGFFKF